MQTASRLAISPGGNAWRNAGGTTDPATTAAPASAAAAATPCACDKRKMGGAFLVGGAIGALVVYLVIKK